MSEVGGANQFEGLEDEAKVWIQIFLEGGELLLQEFSDYRLTQSDYFAQEADAGFMRRLSCVVEDVEMTEAQFWDYALFRLAPHLRFKLAFNRLCPIDVLAAIWIGDYRNLDGSPDIDAAAACAYFNNHEKALILYMEKPELRVVVKGFLKRLFEYTLSKRGLFPSLENTSDTCHQNRAVN